MKIDPNTLAIAIITAGSNARAVAQDATEEPLPECVEQRLLYTDDVDVDACCATNPDNWYCAYHNCLDPEETHRVDEAKGCDCGVHIDYFVKQSSWYDARAGRADNEIEYWAEVNEAVHGACCPRGTLLTNEILDAIDEGWSDGGCFTAITEEGEDLIVAEPSPDCVQQIISEAYLGLPATTDPSACCAADPDHWYCAYLECEDPETWSYDKSGCDCGTFVDFQLNYPLMILEILKKQIEDDEVHEHVSYSPEELAYIMGGTLSPYYDALPACCPRDTLLSDEFLLEVEECWEEGAKVADCAANPDRWYCAHDWCLSDRLDWCCSANVDACCSALPDSWHCAYYKCVDEERTYDECLEENPRPVEEPSSDCVEQILQALNGEVETEIPVDSVACCAANPDHWYCAYNSCVDIETGEMAESEEGCDCGVFVDFSANMHAAGEEDEDSEAYVHAINACCPRGTLLAEHLNGMDGCLYFMEWLIAMEPSSDCVEQLIREEYYPSLPTTTDPSACCAANPDHWYCAHHGCYDPETWSYDMSKGCDCGTYVDYEVNWALVNLEMQKKEIEDGKVLAHVSYFPEELAYIMSGTLTPDYDTLPACCPRDTLLSDEFLLEVSECQREGVNVAKPMPDCVVQIIREEYWSLPATTDPSACCAANPDHFYCDYLGCPDCCYSKSVDNELLTYEVCLEASSEEGKEPNPESFQEDMQSDTEGSPPMKEGEEPGVEALQEDKNSHSELPPLVEEGGEPNPESLQEDEKSDAASRSGKVMGAFSLAFAVVALK